MKRFFIFAVVFLLAGGIFSVYAQDVIILRTGEKIEAQVTELSPTEIRYKAYDNLNGPVVVVPRASVLVIEYQNGKREIINADNAAGVPAAAPAAASAPAAAPAAETIAPNYDRLTVGIYFNPLGFLTMGPIVGMEFTYKHFILDGHLRFLKAGLLMKLIVEEHDAEDSKIKSGMGGGFSLKYYTHNETGGGFYVGPFFDFSSYKAEHKYYRGTAKSDVTVVAAGGNLGYKWAWPHFYLRLGPYFGYAGVVKSDWIGVSGNKEDYSGEGYFFFMADLALGISF